MREIISISAIVIAFFYFLAFGSAVFMALENEMHWVLALFAMAWIIILRLWPLLPVLAVIGAVNVWGWVWYDGVALALPVSIYVVSYYWTRVTDYFRRPKQKQGV
ncbi:MAG: hypothetical protein ACTS1X_13655 [Parasphingopyxis sp.]|uniref:hypothetical protein n=1 Tax=Parasphingopyxis sp. TaxID=1920299 RepID=UPI003FA169F6